MPVFVLSHDEVVGFMRRMSGATIAGDLRSKLAGAEINIDKYKRILTNPKGSLYGQIFWMAGCAEWLMAAEATAEVCRKRLDQMGEPHRDHLTRERLIHHGLLPKNGMST